jgi:pyocin large subunit-like protein
MLRKLTRTSALAGEPVGGARHRLLLKGLAGILVVILGLFAVSSADAPSAEARKKRDRSATTIAGDRQADTSASSTVKPSASYKPKSGSDEAILVFPGAGKRSSAPVAVASKTKPTLVAPSKASGSSANSTSNGNSNRNDPRLRAIGFRSRAKLEQHYEKHGREFGNVSLDEYLAMAQDLRDAPLSNRVVEANQVGGTISRFDRKTGAFTAFDRDLTIRTFFKPNGGEDYFRRAATKTH